MIPGRDPSAKFLKPAAGVRRADGLPCVVSRAGMLRIFEKVDVCELAEKIKDVSTQHHALVTDCQDRGYLTERFGQVRHAVEARDPRALLSYLSNQAVLGNLVSKYQRTELEYERDQFVRNQALAAIQPPADHAIEDSAAAGSDRQDDANDDELHDPPELRVNDVLDMGIDLLQCPTLKASCDPRQVSCLGKHMPRADLRLLVRQAHTAPSIAHFFLCPPPHRSGALGEPRRSRTRSAVPLGQLHVAVWRRSRGVAPPVEHAPP